MSAMIEGRLATSCATLNQSAAKDRRFQLLVLLGPTRIPGASSSSSNTVIFVPYDPDEGGLDFWSSQMTSHCGTGFNDNNACVRDRRVLVSRDGFFAVAYPGAFNDNAQFVTTLYHVYLRRDPEEGGFQFWLNNLNQYGTPASDAGHYALVEAFLYSCEYRLRFGNPSP